MAIEYTKLLIHRLTRVKRCDTDKAWAISDGFKSIAFFSKKHCNLIELDASHEYEYCLEIPEWLYRKSDNIRDSVKFLQKENDERDQRINKS
tara:strand:- start:578 stop:853 length:276 start_codon:yes stop_codon:yes gene_type:complete